MNVNVVCLAGRLTRDPETKVIPSTGKTVANFGLAINEKYKGGDGQLKESTVFVDVEAFGGTAEIIGKYLHKGSTVVVEGKLKSDSWETRQGEKRQKLLVKAERVHFGDKPAAERPARVNDAPPPDGRPAPAADGDDEPPF